MSGYQILLNLHEQELLQAEKLLAVLIPNTSMHRRQKNKVEKLRLQVQRLKALAASEVNP